MRAGRFCQGGFHFEMEFGVHFGVHFEMGFGVHFEMEDPYPPPGKGLVKTSRFLPQAGPLQNQLPITSNITTGEKSTHSRHHRLSSRPI